MYQMLDNPDEEATLDNGVVFHPVATLASEHGGRAQISVDDHCFVLSLKYTFSEGEEGVEDGTEYRYRLTPYWFAEAVDALKSLPSPPDKAWRLIRGK